MKTAAMRRPDSIHLMMKKKSSMVKLPDTLDQHGGNDGRDDDMAADELGIEQLERERGKWGKGIRFSEARGRGVIGQGEGRMAATQGSAGHGTSDGLHISVMFFF